MSFPLITPRHLVIAARTALPVILAGLASLVLQIDCTPSAAVAGFALSLCVLIMAAPRMRAADLVGALVVFMTMLECIHAGTAGNLDHVRWQACIAAAGVVVLLLKVQHLRALARQDAYVPLRQLDRRAALLSRTGVRRPSLHHKA
ncbi:MAG: hypothetical protein QM681_10900 [Novosphingobium sp.]